MIGSYARCVTALLCLAGPGVAPAAVCDCDNPAGPVAHYDFDHPDENDVSTERDQGSSGTPLWLVNGGGAMRVADEAYPGAGMALETRQVNPGRAGNDDWKAGVFEADGVASLAAFSAVDGITLAGWVKPTGHHPSPNSTTEDPDDRFGAVGLFGLLSGTSEGHLVRALLEIITVNGELRLVALGRRFDDGESLLLVADGPWEALLPIGAWTHIAATFDFDNGTMALYRNGVALPAAYTSDEDRWQVGGEPEPDMSSPSLPNGIKIGGSYPQNTQERNPFNGRFDDILFYGRSLGPEQVELLYARYGAKPRGGLSKVALRVQPDVGLGP